jgi:hypothetical protein
MANVKMVMASSNFNCLVRIKDTDLRTLTITLRRVFEGEAVERSERCLVVLSENQLRVRRSPE